MFSAFAKPSSKSPLSSHAFRRSMFAPSLAFVSMLLASTAALGAGSAPLQPTKESASAIVIGFVGGFVHRNDLRHSEVQLAQKLSGEYRGRANVGIFENRRREDAHAAILKWLDRDGDSGLSDSERRQARIIIYGHSWGAAAAVALARQLQTDRIPVLLTIQVDSISKPGLDDRLIPANVARAVNFYQTGGPLHGNREIVAVDPAHTQILGDFRLDYKTEPPPCSVYPWFARHFLKGHTSIECDPNVWSRVEALIGEYLLPGEAQAPATANLRRQIEVDDEEE